MPLKTSMHLNVVTDVFILWKQYKEYNWNCREKAVYLPLNLFSVRKQRKMSSSQVTSSNSFLCPKNSEIISSQLYRTDSSTTFLISKRFLPSTFLQDDSTKCFSSRVDFCQAFEHFILYTPALWQLDSSQRKKKFHDSACLSIRFPLRNHTHT